MNNCFKPSNSVAKTLAKAIAYMWAVMIFIGGNAALKVNAEEFDCEMVNQPVDCSRLTRQECDAKKREQEQRNINRQMYCAQQEIEKALQEAANSGGGTGSGSGSGNSQSQSSDAQSQNSAENSDPEPEQNPVNEPFPNTSQPPPEVTETEQDDGGDGSNLGAIRLCDKFKQAIAKAKTEEAKALLRTHAKNSKC